VARYCVSVVVADRHPFVLCGLKSLLQAESEFKVVAACLDRNSCTEAVRGLSPDLALLDISLPPESGFAVLAAIKSENINTKVVFLSPSLHTSAAVTAIRAGAYGVIPRDATPGLLMRSLRKVAVGQKLLPLTCWDPELRHRPKPDSPATFEAVLAGLTKRERQVVFLVGEGLSNKEVGHQLKLSDGTIKVHLHRIYQKLAIRNRTALAVLAKADVTADRSADGTDISPLVESVKVP
jgi:two-component system nitrate/nitrite response regulator NarL